MKLYEPKQFSFGEIPGISAQQLAVHIALYEGYVKHINTLREQIVALKAGAPAYVRDELRRRYAFEWNGARLHEYYFEQLEGGATSLAESVVLLERVLEKFPSEEAFIEHVKEVAGTRGIGWVIGTYDKREGAIHVLWVADHEIGHLAGAPILFAIDMWEHAFMIDYVPAEKKTYIDAVLSAMNWKVVEERLSHAG